MNVTGQSPIEVSRISDEFVDTDIKIIAVIPAYNEESSIESIVALTKRFVDEIIICDDGSTDQTRNILEKLNVNYIANGKNRGKGHTVRSLFREAIKSNPDIIITIDADYQHDPKDIPKFVREIYQNKSDIVIGSRFVKGSNTDISFFRLFGLTLINYLQRILLKCNVKDTQSGYRAFSRNAFFVILQSKENGYTTESEQLFIAAKHGLKTSEVPVTIRYKGIGSPSKKFFVFHGAELIIYIISYFLKELLGKNTE